MENEIKLNIEYKENENNLKSIDKLEKMLYFIIEKILKDIPIEYLLNNDLILRKYNIYISYNIYNNYLQFHDLENDYYIKNIRFLLLKYDINNLFEYFIIELEKYLINYLDFEKNNEKLYNDLMKIYY